MHRRLRPSKRCQRWDVREAPRDQLMVQSPAAVRTFFWVVVTAGRHAARRSLHDRTCEEQCQARHCQGHRGDPSVRLNSHYVASARSERTLHAVRGASAGVSWSSAIVALRAQPIQTLRRLRSAHSARAIKVLVEYRAVPLSRYFISADKAFM